MLGYAIKRIWQFERLAGKAAAKIAVLITPILAMMLNPFCVIFSRTGVL